MRGPKQQKRVSKRKPPRSVVYIFCEGQDTEVIYFNGFKKRGNNLDIRPFAVQNKAAKNFISEAKKQVDNDNTFNPENGDAVWCVFDRDNNSDSDLAKAKSQADKLGFKIAFSNPAFELWFLLHFVTHRSELKDSVEIIRMLKQDDKLKDYSKSKDYNAYLLPRQKSALKRASELLKQHTDAEHELISRVSNPVTTVSELVEFLNERNAASRN